MKLTPFLSPEQISARISQTAAQIRADYQGREIQILSVLKGSICFTADLIRHLDHPFTLDIIQCISYRGSQRHPLQILGADHLSFHNRHILLVDDIFDTGYTIAGLLPILNAHQPASIKTCILLNTQGVPKASPPPTYTLFDVPSSFMVGYGLDYNEYYRGFPGIHILDLSS